MDHSVWKVSNANSKVMSILVQIRGMVARNHHTEAYILGAKALGANILADKFELIGKLYKLEGHMPRGLSEYQYAVLQDMFRYAKHELDPEIYSEFYSAF